MIQQIRVTLPNEPGTLLGMVKALSDAGVDMKALEVSDRGPGDHGEANIIVSNLDGATQALTAAKIDFTVEDALAVEMDDRVGGLALILDQLAAAEINIRQLYAFVSRVEGKSLAVLSTDAFERARLLLTEHGYNLLDRKRLEEGPPPEDASTITDHLGLDFIW